MVMLLMALFTHPSVLLEHMEAKLVLKRIQNALSALQVTIALRKVLSLLLDCAMLDIYVLEDQPLPDHMDKV